MLWVRYVMQLGQANPVYSVQMFRSLCICCYQYQIRQYNAINSRNKSSSNCLGSRIENWLQPHRGRGLLSQIATKLPALVQPNTKIRSIPMVINDTSSPVYPNLKIILLSTTFIRFQMTPRRIRYLTFNLVSGSPFSNHDLPNSKQALLNLQIIIYEGLTMSDYIQSTCCLTIFLIKFQQVLEEIVNHATQKSIKLDRYVLMHKEYYIQIIELFSKSDLPKKQTEKIKVIAKSNSVITTERLIILLMHFKIMLSGIQLKNQEIERMLEFVGIQKQHYCIIKGEYMSRKQNSCRTGSRLRWTVEEEMILKDIYEEKGITSWISIASFLNQRSSQTKRTAKQCRERYNNFVRLNQQPDKLDWNSQDDSHLFNLYLEKGSKWADIAKMLPGKSENHVKNRFYGILRRTLNAVKKINSKNDRKDKPLKYQTLIKILEKKNWSSECETKAISEKIQFCEKLREDIIQIMKNVDTMVETEAMDVCDRARKFNILTRMENMARNRHYKAGKSKNSLTHSKKPKNEICGLFGLETDSCVHRNSQRQFQKKLEQNEASCMNDSFHQKHALQDYLFNVRGEEPLSINSINMEYCELYEAEE